MKNKDSLRYIAGACFAAEALLLVINLFIVAFVWENGLLDIIIFDGYGLSLLAIVGYVFIAASMFASIPVLTTVGGAVGLIVALISNFRSIMYYSIVGKLLSILYLAFWVIIIIIGFNKEKAKQLGYAAGIVAALRFLILIISRQNIYVYGLLDLRFISFLSHLLLIIGAFLIGYASANMPVKSAAKPSVSAGSTNAVSSESQTDRLIGIKRLLDSGVITQEEFDEKKKQILGL